MSKLTIFGEENFLDTSMIKLVKMRNEAIDNFILEEMENGALVIERSYSSLCLEVKLEYCFKLTDGLQSVLREISND